MTSVGGQEGGRYAHFLVRAVGGPGGRSGVSAGEGGTPGHTTTDPAAAVAMLRARFPGVPIWFGNFTGRYWAIVVGRLVEAATASDLRWILDGFAPTRRGL